MNRLLPAVTAPADARVAQVLVEDGADVTAGTVLVQLASPSAHERLRQARAAQAVAGSGVVDIAPVDLGPLQKPRPGMSAVVELQVRTAKVQAVPSSAVVRDADGLRDGQAVDT